METGSEMADFLSGSACCPERLFDLQAGGASERRLCRLCVCVTPPTPTGPHVPMEPGPLRGGGLCCAGWGGVGVGGCQGVVGDGDKFVSGFF